MWDSAEREPLKTQKDSFADHWQEWPDRWRENEGTWPGSWVGEVASDLSASEREKKSIKFKRPSRGRSTQSSFCERKRWAPHRVSKTESPRYLQFLLKELSIFGWFFLFFFLISLFHLLSQSKHLWFINAWGVIQYSPVQTSRGHIKQ